VIKAENAPLSLHDLLNFTSFHPKVAPEAVLIPQIASPSSDDRLGQEDPGPRAPHSEIFQKSQKLLFPIYQAGLSGGRPRIPSPETLVLVFIFVPIPLSYSQFM
jgi:hypothetical protein